tara:strand:- start:3108 stop:3290 length:183 start_codon:yes stop_codon:yes gene_type:complete
MKDKISNLMDKQIFGYEVGDLLITFGAILAIFIIGTLWITLLEKLGIRKPGQDDHWGGGG